MSNYWVCWKDPFLNDSGIVDHCDGPLDEWVEAEEVCDGFRDEDPETEFYVGYYDGTPAVPGVGEAVELLDHLIRMGWLTRAEYRLLLYHVMEGAVDE